jgi:hypothetical protein
MNEPIREVVSLLVLNLAGQVLLGHRAKTRLRHPGVLSTPTMLISQDEASQLVDRTAYEGCDLDEDTILTRLIAEIQPRLSPDIPTVGWAATEWTITKWIADEHGTGLDELTRMTTIRVDLEQEWELSAHPEFYQDLGWYNQALFLRACEERNADLLSPGNPPPATGGAGACIQSAYHILSR